MKYPHLTSDGKTNHQKLKVSIYCDLQNVYLIQDLANLLLAFANSKGRLICKKVYSNSQCKNQAFAKDKLKGSGFNCIDVPCTLKNSADNRLIADCIKDVNNYQSLDIVILVSGDGDFADLVCTLQNLGKRVIIFAQRGNVKQRLIELVKDDFHFIDDLPHLVVDKTKLNTTFVQPQITYKEASEGLLEVIKFALSQGKRTRFSLIDSLMRQSERCPNYQGVSSIRKPDGTTFSCFSKFVAAVVADGKVYIQTVGKLPELLLIEEDRLAS